MRFGYSYFMGHEVFNLWFVKHMLHNCTRINSNTNNLRTSETKHLEWLRLMWVQLWSICLTNHKFKTSCPMKYEYPNLMLLCLGPKQVLVIVSIRVSLRMPMGYLLPDDKETSPHQNDKTNRQWTPQHLFYLPLSIAFYFEMRHRMSTTGML